MKKIYIIISHSVGEMDTLLPLLYELKLHYLYKVKILVSVKEIHSQIIKNIFYLETIKKLGITIKFSQSFNKFDFNQNLKKNNFFFKKFIQFKYILTNLDILFYNYYMHETTNQKKSTILIRAFSKLLNKKTFIYNHAHSLDQATNINIKYNYNSNNLFLLFSSLNKKWANSIGFKKTKIIGFCKFYPNWTEYVNKYFAETNINEDYVLIYSRPYNHKFYMSYEKYIFLIKSSYKIIRELMGGKKILIKLHPREDPQKIQNLINSLKFTNVHITYENSSVIASKAIFALTFWSSAILDSLSQDIPSIEYYIEDKAFKETQPEGSLYKKNGISSVDNEEKLKKIINMILEKKYIEPEIIKFFKSELNCNIFD